MNKLNLKTYLKKRKQRLSVSGISPQFDWYLILGVGIIMFLSGIVYAVYLYVRINNNSLFESNINQSSEEEIEFQKNEIKKATEEVEQENFDESIIN